jgi:hypothetical protein
VQTSVLIDAIVQRTMVFIAHLATAGGVRAPLAHLANQVFLDLSRELQNQGVKKKVIADMFGMRLRTYHRKVRELQDSQSDVGLTLWEAVLTHLRKAEPVSAGQVHQRFQHDDPELVSGVLNDLVHSQLAYRSGRGATAVYRLANEADFAGADANREEATRYLVWLTIYRQGPLSAEQVGESVQLEKNTCDAAIAELLREGRIEVAPRAERAAAICYRSQEFAVPMGTAQGWEAAVLDHYQAMLSAVGAKLSGGTGHAGPADTLGGSTWSFNVWPGHPLEQEAKGSLGRLRAEMSDLRKRIDEHNARVEAAPEPEQVIFYLGQYVAAADAEESA